MDNEYSAYMDQLRAQADSTGIGAVGYESPAEAAALMSEFRPRPKSKWQPKSPGYLSAVTSDPLLAAALGNNAQVGDALAQSAQYDVSGWGYNVRNFGVGGALRNLASELATHNPIEGYKTAKLQAEIGRKGVKAMLSGSDQDYAAALAAISSANTEHHIDRIYGGRSLEMLGALGRDLPGMVVGGAAGAAVGAVGGALVGLEGGPVALATAGVGARYGMAAGAGLEMSYLASGRTYLAARQNGASHSEASAIAGTVGAAVEGLNFAGVHHMPFVNKFLTSAAMSRVALEGAAAGFSGKILARDMAMGSAFMGGVSVAAKITEETGSNMPKDGFGGALLDSLTDLKGNFEALGAGMALGLVMESGMAAGRLGLQATLAPLLRRADAVGRSQTANETYARVHQTVDAVVSQSPDAAVSILEHSMPPEHQTGHLDAMALNLLAEHGVDPYVLIKAGVEQAAIDAARLGGTLEISVPELMARLPAKERKAVLEVMKPHAEGFSPMEIRMGIPDRGLGDFRARLKALTYAPAIAAELKRIKAELIATGVAKSPQHAEILMAVISPLAKGSMAIDPVRGLEHLKSISFTNRTPEERAAMLGQGPVLDRSNARTTPATPAEQAFLGKDETSRQIILAGKEAELRDTQARLREELAKERNGERSDRGLQLEMERSSRKLEQEIQRYRELYADNPFEDPALRDLTPAQPDELERMVNSLGESVGKRIRTVRDPEAMNTLYDSLVGPGDRVRKPGEQATGMFHGKTKDIYVLLRPEDARATLGSAMHEITRSLIDELPIASQRKILAELAKLLPPSISEGARMAWRIQDAMGENMAETGKALLAERPEFVMRMVKDPEVRSLLLDFYAKLKTKLEAVLRNLRFIPVDPTKRTAALNLAEKLFQNKIYELERVALKESMRARDEVQKASVGRIPQEFFLEMSPDGRGYFLDYLRRDIKAAEKQRAAETDPKKQARLGADIRMAERQLAGLIKIKDKPQLKPPPKVVMELSALESVAQRLAASVDRSVMFHDSEASIIEAYNRGEPDPRFHLGPDNPVAGFYNTTTRQIHVLLRPKDAAHTILTTLHELTHALFNELPGEVRASILRDLKQASSSTQLRRIAKDWVLDPIRHEDAILEEALSETGGALLYDRPDFVLSLMRSPEARTALQAMYAKIAGALKDLANRLLTVVKADSKRTKALDLVQKLFADKAAALEALSHKKATDEALLAELQTDFETQKQEYWNDPNRDPEKAWLYQAAPGEGARGMISTEVADNLIHLLNPENGTPAGVHTVVHEIAHAFHKHFTALLADLRTKPETEWSLQDRQLAEDMSLLNDWAGLKEDATPEQIRAGMEKVARGFERYMMDGRAPTKELEPIFSQLGDWMRSIYASLKEIAGRTPAQDETPVAIPAEVAEVFDRWMSAKEGADAAATSSGIDNIAAGLEKMCAALPDGMGEAGIAALRNAMKIVKAKAAQSRMDRLEKAEKLYRDMIRPQVEKETRAEPLYAALAELGWYGKGRGKRILIDPSGLTEAEAASLGAAKQLAPGGRTLDDIVVSHPGVTRAELVAHLTNDPSSPRVTLDQAIQKRMSEQLDIFRENIDPEQIETKGVLVSDALDAFVSMLQKAGVWDALQRERIQTSAERRYSEMRMTPDEAARNVEQGIKDVYAKIRSGEAVDAEAAMLELATLTKIRELASKGAKEAGDSDAAAHAEAVQAAQRRFETMQALAATGPEDVRTQYRAAAKAAMKAYRSGTPEEIAAAMKEMRVLTELQPLVDRAAKDAVTPSKWTDSALLNEARRRVGEMTVKEIQSADALGQRTRTAIDRLGASLGRTVEEIGTAFDEARLQSRIEKLARDRAEDIDSALQKSKKLGGLEPERFGYEARRAVQGQANLFGLRGKTGYPRNESGFDNGRNPLLPAELMAWLRQQDAGIAVSDTDVVLGASEGGTRVAEALEALGTLNYRDMTAEQFLEVHHALNYIEAVGHEAALNAQATPVRKAWKDLTHNLALMTGGSMASRKARRGLEVLSSLRTLVFQIRALGGESSKFLLNKLEQALQEHSAIHNAFNHRIVPERQERMDLLWKTIVAAGKTRKDNNYNMTLTDGGIIDPEVLAGMAGIDVKTLMTPRFISYLTHDTIPLTIRPQFIMNLMDSFGAKYNVDAIEASYGWEAGTVETILSGMTDRGFIPERAWEITQNRWNFSEEVLFPVYDKAYRAINYGLPLKREAFRPFTMGGKEYAGGYHPVAIDTRYPLGVTDRDPLGGATASSVGAPAANRSLAPSSSRDRVGTGGRPLNMEHDILANHYKEVAAYSAYGPFVHETLKEVGRGGEGSFADQYVRAFGRTEYNALLHNLQRALRRDPYNPTILDKATDLSNDQMMKLLTAWNFTMGANVVQSMPLFLREMKINANDPRWLNAEMILHGKLDIANTYKWVLEHDAYMELRFHSIFESLCGEHLSEGMRSPKVARTLASYQRIKSVAMASADAFGVMPFFGSSLIAHITAVSVRLSERLGREVLPEEFLTGKLDVPDEMMRDAVAYASGVITRTNPTRTPEATSAMQARRGLAGLFAPFTTIRGTVLNRNIDALIGWIVRSPVSENAERMTMELPGLKADLASMGDRTPAHQLDAMLEEYAGLDALAKKEEARAAAYDKLANKVAERTSTGKEPTEAQARDLALLSERLYSTREAGVRMQELREKIDHAQKQNELERRIATTEYRLELAKDLLSENPTATGVLWHMFTEMMIPALIWTVPSAILGAGLNGESNRDKWIRTMAEQMASQATMGLPIVDQMARSGVHGMFGGQFYDPANALAATPLTMLQRTAQSPDHLQNWIDLMSFGTGVPANRLYKMLAPKE